MVISEGRPDSPTSCRQSCWPLLQVFEWLICSDASLDSHRFMDTIEEAIAEKDVKRYKVSANPPSLTKDFLHGWIQVGCH